MHDTFVLNAVDKSAAGRDYGILEFDAGEVDGEVGSTSSSGGGGGHRVCSVTRGAWWSKVFAQTFVAPASLRLRSGQACRLSGGRPPAHRAAGTAALQD